MREDVYKLNNIRVANVPVDELKEVVCIPSARTFQVSEKETIKSKKFDNYKEANKFLTEQAENTKITGKDEMYFVTCVWQSGFTLPTAIKLDETKIEKKNLIQEEISRSMMTAVGYLIPKDKTPEQIARAREWNVQDASMLRKALSRLGGIREEFERCIREHGKTIDMTVEVSRGQIRGQMNSRAMS